MNTKPVLLKVTWKLTAAPEKCLSAIRILALG